MKILGVEPSYDETAVAIVADRTQAHSNIAHILDFHRKCSISNCCIEHMLVADHR